MFLPPLHLPLISAGCFGGVVQRLLDFVSLRVRRSEQGMTPSLSPGLRGQTVALHRRLVMLTSEFHRLARLARDGKLRVYPDRPSPAARTADAGTRPRAALRPQPPSPFGPPTGVPQGPTLAALPTRGFGWILGFVPASSRDALAGLLRHPEMVALIGASPAVSRLLRPLCNGLGVVPPEGVFRLCPAGASGHVRGGARALTASARTGSARTGSARTGSARTGSARTGTARVWAAILMRSARLRRARPAFACRRNCVTSGGASIAAPRVERATRRGPWALVGRRVCGVPNAEFRSAGAPRRNRYDVATYPCHSIAWTQGGGIAARRVHR